MALLLTLTLLVLVVGEYELDGGKANGGLGDNGRPEARVEVAVVGGVGGRVERRLGEAYVAQESEGTRVEVGALLEAGQEAEQNAGEARPQRLPQRQEVRLVDGEQHRLDAERRVGEQRKEAARVEEQVAAERVRADVLKEHRVDLERLEVHAARQRRVQALRQPLAHRYALGYVSVLGIGLEALLELAQRRDQIGPLGRRLEVLERFVHRARVALVLAVVGQQVHLLGRYETHLASA